MITYARGAHPNGATWRRSVMPKLQAGELAFLALVAAATAALVVFCGWRDNQTFPPVTRDPATIYRAMEQ